MASKKIKNETIDDLLRKCVRERDDWTCQYSNLVDANGQMTKQSTIIETCHIFGRRTLSMRWHPDNLISLSKDWHRFFTENPREWRKWVEWKLGTVRYWALQGRFNQYDIKYTPDDRKAIAEHFRAEFERLCELRNDGARGRLALVAFD